MGKFTFTQTEIPGVVVIEPQVFGDDRGYFMETYQKDQFAEAGIDKEFVQDNQSRSTRGVLRGLHFHDLEFFRVLNDVGGRHKEVLGVIKLNQALLMQKNERTAAVGGIVGNAHRGTLGNVRGLFQCL